MNRPLSPSALRWRCDAATLPFETTDDLPDALGIVGQASAVEALRFGLECDAHGQNVFVRGLTGTGRMTLIQQMLRELEPQRRQRLAFGYVNNFSEPDRPRLIALPEDKAKDFKRRVRELAEYIRDGLREALEGGALKAEREGIELQVQQDTEKITETFEKELAEAGLRLVTLQHGPIAQPALLPVIDEEPVSPDDFERLHAQGKVSDEQHAAWREGRRRFQKRLGEVAGTVREIHRRGREEIRARTEEAARRQLDDLVGSIFQGFGGGDVRRFLAEVVDDVVENRLIGDGDETFDPLRLYGVNMLLEHDGAEGCPIVVENTPTMTKLLGTVEHEWGPHGPEASDYRKIRAGSLLRANGGYLILDVRDVLVEPGAWKVLVRTLRTSCLEIVPPELGFSLWQASLKPEPIPVKLRVILVGDTDIYYLLDRHDPDFGHLFKVLADFDSVIEREPDGAVRYGEVLARIAKEEGLPAFHRSAVAALAEHGARVAGLHGKLTARFGRIADIAREAAFLARKAGGERVDEGHVAEAVRRTKRRADLPSRRFRELLRDGTIHIRTRGREVGQINGLAMIHAGPVSYGFPARITASIGAGSAGLINIEGQAQLSGAIHTKGFHILGGLLRHLLQSDHPLAFSASLAFEQSYGGIDGDSASAAEIICLLSALTGVPIRQDLAITGSIDQLGRIQAIGGVNEKIEGFFDACGHSETGDLVGSQGVVLPRTNAGDLMLRGDVVEACEAGRFHVYAVDRVHQALEIFTGVPAGERGEDGHYPAGTLLAQAVDKAREFWLKTVQRPATDTSGTESSTLG